MPDVIDTWPPNVAKVDYSSSTSANLGNVLTIKETQRLPTIYFPSEHNAHYTVMLVDPDALSRKTHEFRNFCPYVQVNIPGTGSEHVDVHKGHNVVPYMGPAPPANSGLHRYVFLVFKQHGAVDTHNMAGFGKEADSRKSFVPEQWLRTTFGGSVPTLHAANFFQAEHA